MLKTVLIRLFLLVPFALAAVLSLGCDEMEPKLETDWVFRDTTGTFEIPAQGYMYFKAEVTPEMLEVKDLKQVFLQLTAPIMSAPNNARLVAYLMDETNFLSFHIGGPFECISADSSLSYPAVSAYVNEAGDFYGVLSNRYDTLPKRAKVGYMLQHWAMVPK